MAKIDVSKEADLLAALIHPLRRRILRRMRDVETASASGLAKEFNHPLGNVAYHVRVLADCGAITLVRRKKVRGGDKHFYRQSLSQPWANELIDLEAQGEGCAAAQE